MSLTDLKRTIFRLIVALSVTFTVLLAGCNSQSKANVPVASPVIQIPSIDGHEISEVSPPNVIQELRQLTEGYQPQVSILSPKPNEVLNTDQVEVRFQVNDLPLFSDPKLGMGPHLEVILDNQPYFMVYDLSQPLTLPDLEPGTHTLRVFASRPWHESFKNEGAYAQTTFHVFTQSQTNTPNPELPLLTYSRPTGTYGAEPILLDFYLTNAPLHLVAEENAEDDIRDWRIRCTVNGESFLIDRWQPIYLKGFKKGKNWVKLEFLDEKGDPVKNEFNTTVRMFTYEPNGQDTLSKLMRGKLTLAQARGMVDGTYTTPEPAQSTEPSPTVSEPSPEPTMTVPAETALPEVSPELLSPSTQKSDQQEPTIEASPVMVPPASPETPEVLPEASPVPSLESQTTASDAVDQANPTVESANDSTSVSEAENGQVATDVKSSENQPDEAIGDNKSGQPDSTEIVQPEQPGSAEQRPIEDSASELVEEGLPQEPSS